MSYKRKIEHRFTTEMLVDLDDTVVSGDAVHAPSDDLPEGFNAAQPWDLVSTHTCKHDGAVYLVAVWRRVIEGIG
jgi:hypothetical protein